MSEPPLHYLRFFVQAAAAGSFTRAALELGVTPAAISRNVGLLEKQLGAQLIQRSTRRMRLTPEGQEYFERVREALGLMEEAGQILKDQRDAVSGSLRITTVSFFGKHVLLPLLGSFREHYPQVQLEVAFDDRERSLLAGDFDLAIHRMAVHEQSLVSRRLGYLPLGVAAHPDYLRRRGIPQVPQDLEQHDGIVARLPDGLYDTWSFAPAARKSAGASTAPIVHVRPRPALVIAEQLDAVMDAVLQGQGVALMSVSPALPPLRDGRLRLLLPQWQIVSDARTYSGLFLHYAQRRYQPRRLRLLINFLVTHFRTQPQRLDPTLYAR